MIEGLNLTGANGKKRRELDYYPTPPECTIALMGFLALPRNTTIWEPACGNGAMAEVLQQYTDMPVVQTDIAEGFDFLDPEKHYRVDCDAIITNPPFNLSEQFIRLALEKAKIVAMLLKSQYWHARKRSHLFYQHRPAHILPLTWRPDFRGGELGGSPTMEVAWTVWIAGRYNTEYRPLLRPEALDMSDL